MIKHKYITYREARGIYQIKITLGRGKDRKQIVKQAKTLDDALAIRNELLRLNHIDPAILADKPAKATAIEKLEPKNFREAFQQWFDETVKPTAKINTVGNYHATMLLFFPIIGSMRPGTISHDMMQDIFTAIQQKHRYTTGYMVSHVSRIKRMYDWGIKHGWYSHNPCIDIKLAKTESVPKRALTKDELRRFFHSAKEYGGDWYLLFYLYKITGCRRGEIAGLRWADVDLKSKCIHINSSLKYDYVNHTQVLGSPKTKSSIRTIPISDKMVFALQLRKRLGHYNDKRYVFEQANGQPLRLTNISDIFGRIRDIAGLDKRLSLHCLRHTLASALITSGVDIPTVQRIGGWSTPDILLKTYAHSNDEAARQALEKVVF